MIWSPRFVLLFLIAAIALAASANAQSSATQSVAPAAPIAANDAELLKSTEAFVRNLFGWGAAFKVKMGPLEATPSPDFYRVPIVVTIGDQTEGGEVFVSKDGKTLLRGEIFDTKVDPFAVTRSKLRLEGDPSKGPADAKVTVVEFSDFQCPHCAQLYTIMQSVEQKFPQIRVVYKDFPLVAIHPWSMSASLAGRCAFAQKPESFWIVHDLIFDNQDLISTENVYEKMVDFASRAGLDKDAFKACMASPEARKGIEADLEEGKAIQISSTPTVFVNARPVIGGDQATLEQYIQFELARQGGGKTSGGSATSGATPGASAAKAGGNGGPADKAKK